jgi:hypothetical protein
VTAGRRRAAALAELDRRWIYVALAAAILVAMLAKLRFPERPAPIVQAVYDRLESLPAGTPVLFSFDYSPNSAPEIEPMAFALARHALHRGHRLILLSTWDTGNAMIQRLVERMIRHDFPDKVEGTDWVALGYKAGDEMLINAVRQNLYSMYAADMAGRPLAGQPALAGVRSAADCGLIVALSAGTPGLKEWILYAGDVAHVPVAGGATGVGTPEFAPYYPRQLIGLLGGLKGAAEYEGALARGHPEWVQGTTAATDAMGPQAVAHAVIVLFILAGNAGLLLARRRAKGSA